MDSNQIFYKNCGKLLYAIANADKTITEQEVDSLKKTVTSFLVPLESSTDEFGSDNAHIAEFEFDVLAEKGVSAESAFESFKEYVHANKNNLDARKRELLYKIAEEVANSFKHTNKSEQHLLTALKELLA